MTEDLTVCEARLEDAAAITEIYAHYVLNSNATFETDPPDEAESARRIREFTKGGYPFLVMREGAGRVVAFGFTQRYGRRAGYRYSVETTLYVHPDCVGRGIGTALLNALLAACEERGFRQAFAVIAASEPASVILHARAGFFPVGTLTGAGWKHGEWIDVFLMQRKLGAGNEAPPTADHEDASGRDVPGANRAPAA